MKKLRVLVRFRDERNFFLIHEVGDIITVNDPERVTRLIEYGLCEEVDEPKAEVSDSPELVQTATEKSAQEVKPNKRTNRKKKEA